MFLSSASAFSSSPTSAARDAREREHLGVSPRSSPPLPPAVVQKECSSIHVSRQPLVTVVGFEIDAKKSIKQMEVERMDLSKHSIASDKQEDLPLPLHLHTAILLPVLIALHIWSTMLIIWGCTTTTSQDEQFEHYKIALHALKFTLPLAKRLHASSTFYTEPKKQNNDYWNYGQSQGLIPESVITQTEDIAFRAVFPSEARTLHESCKQIRDAKVLEWAQSMLVSKLKAECPSIFANSSVTSRVKGLYSLWCKWKIKKKTVSDGLGLRICIDDRSFFTMDHEQESGSQSSGPSGRQQSIASITKVLQIVQDTFVVHSIAYTVKDYTKTNKKDNGYESVHCCFLLLVEIDKTQESCSHDKKLIIPFEVQIRTSSMHEAAECGACAHWKYKNMHGLDDIYFLEDLADAD